MNNFILYWPSLSSTYKDLFDKFTPTTTNIIVKGLIYSNKTRKNIVKTLLCMEKIHYKVGKVLKTII